MKPRVLLVVAVGAVIGIYIAGRLSAKSKLKDTPSTDTQSAANYVKTFFG